MCLALILLNKYKLFNISLGHISVSLTFYGVVLSPFFHLCTTILMPCSYQCCIYLGSSIYFHGHPFSVDTCI